MAAKSRAGRRLSTPETPVGELIVEHLRAANLTEKELAARLHVSRVTLWRLLHGQTVFTNRVRVLDLCHALELDGEREAALIRVWLEAAGPRARPTRRSVQARALAEQVVTALQASQYAQYARDADRAESVATFSAFVAEHVRTASLSYTKVAHALGVKTSTLTRLIQGKTAATHQIRVEALADALSLGGVSRRTFLRLAMEAGVFALGAGMGTAPYQTRFMALERLVGKSLDTLDAEIGELQPLCDNGGAYVVLPRAEEIFQQLYDSGSDPALVKRSPELARVKVHAGFLLIVARAATLGWYDRTWAMLETCDRMQNEVFGHLGAIPEGYETEYGHLINQSAPLYRMLGDISQTASGYDTSIRRFTYAITTLEKRVQDDALCVAFYRNRAHVYAVRGIMKEWRADLESAERVARAIRGPLGEVQQAMVTYSWGEGYKRLATLPSTPPEKRKTLAGWALKSLEQAHGVLPHEWTGYGLLLRVAEAQALVWSEPDEALGRAASLREEASHIYPSLVQKIERLHDAAERQRQTRWPHTWR